MSARAEHVWEHLAQASHGCRSMVSMSVGTVFLPTRSQTDVRRIDQRQPVNALAVWADARIVAMGLATFKGVRPLQPSCSGPQALRRLRSRSGAIRAARQVIQ